MKRPLLIVALWYAGGLLLAEFIALPLLLLFGVSFGLLIASLLFSQARPVLIAALLLFAGWTNLTTRTSVLSPHDLRRVLGDRVEIVTLRGRLLATPTQRVYEQGEKAVQRTLARIDATSLRRGEAWQPVFGRVAVTTPGNLGTNYFGGQVVQITGVIRPPKGPAAEGLFDYRVFLRRLGIYYQLQVETANDWQILPADGGPRVRPIADRFRDWAKATLQRGLPDEDQAVQLTRTMALGWTTALTGEVSEPFMRTGTMHIFAISGLHIALIAGILVALLRGLQVPRGPCGWLVIPLIWFYTAATGWQSSAIRSAIMMSVIIGGWALRRPSDLLNSLAAAGFIILLWDPQQLFQASFQLSFFVVLSIALLLPPLEKLRQRVLRTDPLLPPELRPRWRQRLDGPVHFVTTGFATSLAAWLGSLPLIAFYFHLFTPISLLANLVIVPLSSLALACDLGSLFSAWWPWLCGLFNYSGWFWMEAIIKLSDWFAALPGAYLYVRSPAWSGFLVYYTLLFGTLTGWLLARQRRIWAGIGSGVLTIVALVQWQAHRHDIRVTVLPLSGGDSIFVDATGRANDLLIDCGSESAAKFVVEPFLHGQGVNRLSRMLLTHGDIRHIGGAGPMEKEFSTEQILTSSVRFRSAKYREIVDQLSPRHHRQINRGERFGNWTVLHPQADDHFPEADDNALVLRGKFHGVHVLFCSDLGRPGQRALLEREGDLHAEVVVCGIPLRGEPLDDALLDAVQPRVIIVSASEVPAQERATNELRERLERRKIPVFYTSDDGAVTITLRPHGWEVDAMNRKQFSVIAK